MRRVIALALSCVLVAACAGDGDEVLVSAAASLTDAFAELESRFEAANPGADVVVNLGASSHLREQILQGAPVDVFASASIAIMEELVAAGRVDDHRLFASNSLMIAVPAGNPGGVAGLADLAREDLLVGVCAPDAPCGRYARLAFAQAGITPSVDTEEPSVRSLLTKIAAGELDAGVVYATDVLAGGGDVEGIGFEPRVPAEYSIAVLPEARPHDLAAAFAEYVVSDEGQSVLAEYGFAAP